MTPASTSGARVRTSPAWTESRRTPASGPADGCCWGCRPQVSAGRSKGESRLARGPLPEALVVASFGSIGLFFQLFLLVAAETLDEVVDAAAQGAEEVGYAPGTQDQEHHEHQQYLEEADAHR